MTMSRPVSSTLKMVCFLSKAYSPPSRSRTLTQRTSKVTLFVVFSSAASLPTSPSAQSPDLCPLSENTSPPAI